MLLLTSLNCMALTPNTLDFQQDNKALWSEWACWELRVRAGTLKRSLPLGTENLTGSLLRRCSLIKIKVLDLLKLFDFVLHCIITTCWESILLENYRLWTIYIGLSVVPLACLHDQSKSSFYPANQNNLKSIQKALIGWKKAGPLKKPLLFWWCKQAICTISVAPS